MKLIVAVGTIACVLMPLRVAALPSNSEAQYSPTTIRYLPTADGELKPTSPPPAPEVKAIAPTPPPQLTPATVPIVLGRPIDYRLAPSHPANSKPKSVPVVTPASAPSAITPSAPTATTVKPMTSGLPSAIVPPTKPTTPSVPISAPATAIAKPTTPPVPSAIVPPPPPPPPPKAPTAAETPNNPLGEPQDIDKILNTTMTADQWVLMYQPLDCLDTSLECIQKLQQQSVENSPLIVELNSKIQEVNSRIEEARVNNKKSIELSIFEPALQAFLRKDSIVENGQTRTVGFFERIGMLFSNPGAVLNDLFAASGVQVLRGMYGGNDAQQSRAIQISDLTVKVAEMERGKVEIANKIRDKIQDLVLAFDVAAREFQAEQAIVKSETRSFKLYAITYAAGDGDTNTYLQRKEQLERSKLKVFKDWSKLRAQIANLKNMVVPRDVL